MVLSPCQMLVLLLATIFLSGTAVKCATYENVTMILTTRRTVFYTDGIEPAVPVLIRHDNTLTEYINRQPLDIIKIEKQSVPKLTENSVANLRNVTEVAITLSGVKDIEPGTFRNLPLLEYLNLSGNLLEEIKNGVFANLENLDSLYLENNRISILGDKAFNDLPEMAHLFIDHNRISTWKSEWFNGSPVNSISMAHNLLKELPKDMFEYFLQFHPGYPIQLWYLVLNDNKINKIHPDAFRGLEELSYLNLQNNEIEVLPPGLFSTIKEINNFQLSDNRISHIDVAKVFANTKLTYVYLNNNRLRCFPVEIVNVTEIYRLEIDGNPLDCECVKKWEREHKRNITSLANLKNDC